MSALLSHSLRSRRAARPLAVGLLFVSPWACAPGTELTQQEGPGEKAGPGQEQPGIEPRFAAAALARPAVLMDAVAPDAVFRFINGADQAPSPMSAADIQREFGDAFGSLVLAKGARPSTLDDIVKAMDGVTFPATGGSQLAKIPYMIAEGGQIPASAAIPRSDDRNERYAITWSDAKSIQVLVSAGSREPTFHQVIGWDAKKGAFNFYELVKESDGQQHWSWAGDSTWALKPETRGVGCFDCHHNGVPIMKELDRPWNNWNSELAGIAGSNLPKAVAEQALFKGLHSASQLESGVEGLIGNYYGGWIDKQISPDGTKVTNVAGLLRHLTGNTTVNLRSSLMKSGGSEAKIPLPPDFYLSDFSLRTTLKLGYAFPSGVQLDGDQYRAYLSKHDWKIELCNMGPDKTCEGKPLYSVPGGTFFAGLTPAPSFEDQTVISMLLAKRIRGGSPVALVSPHFAASILMVDFQNPVFSEPRAKLQAYAEKISSATISGAASDIPELFAAEVKKSSPGAADPKGSPEQQFLYYFGLAEGEWKSVMGQHVEAYLKAVEARLAKPGGTAQYMDLLRARRFEFESTPLIENLFEFSLIFPMGNQPQPERLRMHLDGSVGS